MTVELSAQGIAGGGYYYATVKLPALDHELQDAMQKLRLTDGRNAWMGCSVQLCESLPELADTRLDSPSMEELNFFAYRLSQLDEEQAITLRGVWQHFEKEGRLEEPVSMKDLINMTYGLDYVTMVYGVFSDEDLGQMVVENDLNEDISQMSEASVALLDLEAVGKQQRESEGGILVESYYVVAGEYELQEIYDGHTLPDAAPGGHSALRIQIADSQGGEPAWITLPTDTAIKNGVCCGLESPIPQIHAEQIRSMKDLHALNAIAQMVGQMQPMEQMKLKAVLETEEPAAMDEILDITRHLGEYQLEYRVTDTDGFFKEYLRHHLDPRFDPQWLEGLPSDTEGAFLLERLGARETAYGIVSARGSSLYELVPYQQEQVQEKASKHEMSMAGF